MPSLLGIAQALHLGAMQAGPPYWELNDWPHPPWFGQRPKVPTFERQIAFENRRLVDQTLGCLQL